MRRLVISILVLGSLAFAAPVAASEGKPTREVYEVSGGTLPAGEACSFPLAFEPIVANEYVLTFPERSDGAVLQLISGRLVTRFTNVTTGESVVYNTGGPARFVTYPDGSFTATNYGPTFAWQTPAEGGPTAFLNYGRMVWEVSAPDFLFILKERTGRMIDLCEALG